MRPDAGRRLGKRHGGSKRAGAGGVSSMWASDRHRNCAVHSLIIGGKPGDAGSGGAEVLDVDFAAAGVFDYRNRTIKSVREGFQTRDADRRNPKTKGQTPRGGNRNSDTGEVARAGADRNCAKIAPAKASFLKHLFQKRQKPFGLAFLHHFFAQDDG